MEFRKQLDLEPSSPLSADQLAQHLGISVWSVNDVIGLSGEDKIRLVDESDDSWSALTLRIGVDNLVVYKPVTSPGRRNNIIMHELAHITLGHELADACILEDGSLVPGNFNQDQEDEADWLAGTLLLPRPALLLVRSRRFAEDVACDRYMVSREMLIWRIRMTGVDHQLARRTA